MVCRKERNQAKLIKQFEEILNKKSTGSSDLEKRLTRVDVEDLFRPFTI